MQGRQLKYWRTALVGVVYSVIIYPSLATANQSMLSGNLSSAGSDTMVNLMSLWSANFSQDNPNVNVQLQAAGSSSAPTALAAGAAQLGPMSRPMKAAEVSAFEQRYGYPPLAVPVALDALVVLVHQDNPLREISFNQLDSLYSTTLRCGEASPITHWKKLGLGGEWKSRAISLYGRNSASGTYGYFKQQVLCDGDFSPRVNELPGSASVVQAVAGSLNSIGYASIGFRASGVRTLAVSKFGSPAVEPTAENIVQGRYPLVRHLYIYVNKAPGRPLSPLTAAFMDSVLSEQGQKLVLQDGYMPLSAADIARVRAELGLK
ncbi:phosphate ABC transporter substrate-binding protein [Hafnia paralvei]|uniref:PstS family phosphate ABC transporter substrate-binding protein n=1 Tax=Hafnia paralvei TaxID=546367 RepID=UPI00076B78B8|nr:phosphate ABC transporter substrate-binding protein PstS family protein [Hafnia paralvei]AMH18442.1 phosphate ABC transporter substrate-binding protein [Hafnia paralvei]MCK2179611.1 phosphate ABC transporter substrate-binding protein PstS family protein [Hafnia paralvei]